MKLVILNFQWQDGSSADAELFDYNTLSQREQDIVDRAVKDGMHTTYTQSERDDHYSKIFCHPIEPFKTTNVNVEYIGTYDIWVG